MESLNKMPPIQTLRDYILKWQQISKKDNWSKASDTDAEAELAWMSWIITFNHSGIFEYISSSFTQFSSQVEQPSVTVSLLTSAWYQEHQLSRWHNITSESNVPTNKLVSGDSQKYHCACFPKTVLSLLKGQWIIVIIDMRAYKVECLFWPEVQKVNKS